MGKPRLRGARVSTSSLDLAKEGEASATAWNNWGSFHDSLNHKSASHSKTSWDSSAMRPQAVHRGESQRPAACNLAADQRLPQQQLRKHDASKTGKLRNTDNSGARKGSAGKLVLPLPASRHNITSASLLASHLISVGLVEISFTKRPRRVRKTPVSTWGTHPSLWAEKKTQGDGAASADKCRRKLGQRQTPCTL